MKVKFGKPRNKDLNLGETDRKAYELIIKLINDRKSHLMVDLTDGRKCIENEQIFITMTNNKITIFNEENFYDMMVDNVVRDNILNKFLTKISRRINVAENKRKIKVQNGLDNMSKSL